MGSCYYLNDPLMLGKTEENNKMVKGIYQLLIRNMKKVITMILKLKVMMVMMVMLCHNFPIFLSGPVLAAWNRVFYHCMSTVC